MSKNNTADQTKDNFPQWETRRCQHHVVWIFLSRWDREANQSRWEDRWSFRAVLEENQLEAA